MSRRNKGVHVPGPASLVRRAIRLSWKERQRFVIANARLDYVPVGSAGKRAAIELNRAKNIARTSGLPMPRMVETRFGTYQKDRKPEIIVAN